MLCPIPDPLSETCSQGILVVVFVFARSKIKSWRWHVHDEYNYHDPVHASLIKIIGYWWDICEILFMPIFTLMLKSYVFKTGVSFSIISLRCTAVWNLLQERHVTSNTVTLELYTSQTLQLAKNVTRIIRSVSPSSRWYASQCKDFAVQGKKDILLSTVFTVLLL